MSQKTYDYYIWLFPKFIFNNLLDYLDTTYKGPRNYVLRNSRLKYYSTYLFFLWLLKIWIWKELEVRISKKNHFVFVGRLSFLDIKRWHRVIISWLRHRVSPLSCSTWTVTVSIPLLYFRCSPSNPPLPSRSLMYQLRSHSLYTLLVLCDSESGKRC